MVSSWYVCTYVYMQRLAEYFDKTVRDGLRLMMSCVYEYLKKIKDCAFVPILYSKFHCHICQFFEAKMVESRRHFNLSCTICYSEPILRISSEIALLFLIIIYGIYVL